MIITSDKVMEEIVENNPDLKWDGWDVIRTIKSPGAKRSKSGFDNRAWSMVERIPLTEDGWILPDGVNV